MATFYFLLETDGTSKILKEDADYLVGETHVAEGGAIAPTAALQGPLEGPFGGPVE